MEKRKWEKSPEKLVSAFYEVMEFFPNAELKKMFGYPCAFFQGQMFVGLHEDNLVVRLDEETRQMALDKKQGAIFAPMNGRVMKEYVALSQENIYNPSVLKDFISRSLSYAQSLPPKKSKSDK